MRFFPRRRARARPVPHRDHRTRASVRPLLALYPAHFPSIHTSHRVAYPFRTVREVARSRLPSGRPLAPRSAARARRAQPPPPPCPATTAPCPPPQQRCDRTRRAQNRTPDEGTRWRRARWRGDGRGAGRRPGRRGGGSGKGTGEGGADVSVKRQGVGAETAATNWGLAASLRAGTRRGQGSPGPVRRGARA